MTLRPIVIRVGVVIAITLVILVAIYFSFLSDGGESCENIIGSDPPQACESP